MTKLTQPLGSSEARGKLGGLVYNTWRGISYVKAKATPGNQGTPRRLAVRALAKQCTTRWQSITNAQRALWNDYAAGHTDIDWTGNPKRLSGYNWFIRTNVRLLDIGLSIIDTPPTRSNMWPALSPAASQTNVSLEITWSLPPSTPDTDLQVDVWTTKSQSAGRQPKIEDAKHLAYEPSESGSYTTPPLANGTYGIFLRTIDELTGLASPWSLVSATITESFGASEGPNLPTLGSNRSERPDEWTDPDFACIEDANSAGVELLANTRSDDLYAEGFGFDIPLNATIVGMTVGLKLSTTEISSVFVQAFNGADLLGNEKESASEIGPLYWLNFGDVDDKWGIALTPLIVNDPSFGVAVSIKSPELSAADAYIDVIQITIFYSL